TAALRPSRTARVDVFGVADRAGNSMGGPFASSFTTLSVVGVDTDGDGFPDDVEAEAGSNPLDPASTPIGMQPVTDAGSAPFSVLNTSSLAGSSDPALFVGQATSAPFAVLNTSTVRDTTDPTLFVGQATSAPFAVLNTSTVRDTTDPTLFVGQATSAPFAVLNTSTVRDSTHPALFIPPPPPPPFPVPTP